MQQWRGIGKKEEFCLRGEKGEGRLSLAVELYQALGRSEDVKRLLNRQKLGGE